MLTERDLAIFAALARYRYLRSTYLYAFAGGASQTRFKERLGDLFHEGYLDRPEAQWRFADARTAPAVYELGLGAKAVLSARGRVDDERRVLLGTGVHRQFLHSLMICEVLASIELAASSDPALRFIPFPEILAKAPTSTRNAKFPLRIPVGTDRLHVIPDALFGLEYRTGSRPLFRFFALEADRGTMPVQRNGNAQTSYLTKLEAYQRLIAADGPKNYLGVPNLLILTVTTSEDRTNNMMQALGANRGSCAAFLFKAEFATAAPLLSILATPWARAGRAPFSIMVARLAVAAG